MQPAHHLLEVVFIQFGKMRAKSEAEKANVIDRDEKASQIDRQNLRKKEIRVRLSWDEWEQITEEACKLHTSHNSLAHEWILEGLSKTRDERLAQGQP